MRCLQILNQKNNRIRTANESTEMQNNHYIFTIVKPINRNEVNQINQVKNLKNTNIQIKGKIKNCLNIINEAEAIRYTYMTKAGKSVEKCYDTTHCFLNNFKNTMGISVKNNTNELFGKNSLEKFQIISILKIKKEKKELEMILKISKILL